MQMSQAINLPTKICKHCNEEKVLTLFPPNKEMRDGRINRCSLCSSKATMVSRNKPENKKNFKNKSYLRLYGITLEEYDAMRVKQQHRCYICNKHESENGKALAVDHNHTTGEVRKLLCSPCNTALGLFTDSADVVEKALLYLKEHSKDTDGR